MIIILLFYNFFTFICRYQKAEQEPPKVLYTDRDCCSDSGSKLKVAM